MRNRLVIGAVFVGGIAGYAVRGALAATPTNTPLSFAGRLTHNGVAINSPGEIIVVRLFDGTSTARCQSSSAAGVPVVDGHFRVALNAACEDALATYGDLWAEVEYPSGSFMPRTKVGPVPYAVEAKRAAQASLLVGAQADALTTLGARRAVAVKYQSGGGQTLAAGAANRINFNSVQFDLPTPAVTTGTSWAFTAPETGVYAVTAIVSLAGGTGAPDKYVHLSVVTPAGQNIIAYRVEAAGLVLGGSTLVKLNAGEAAHIMEGHNAAYSYTVDTDPRFNAVTFNLVN